MRPRPEVGQRRFCGGSDDSRWQVLGLLNTLIGFASTSTDAYLLTMAPNLSFDTGTIELTVAGYLIGVILGRLVWRPA